MKKHIIVGDIHSNHIGLIKLLNTYDPEDYDYIFLGDYCDYRQENPRVNSNYIAVMTQIMTAVKNFGAIALLGNHDDKLIRWFKGNKVEVKEGLSETIFDIEKERASKNGMTMVDNIKEFLNTLPLLYEKNINGKLYKFAHAYHPLETEIFARKNDSTPSEWKKMREHAIYGVPRTPEGERVFWWETGKYLDRITNHIKVAGHYHLTYFSDKAIILDSTPEIVSYIIEDKKLELW